MSANVQDRVWRFSRIARVAWVIAAGAPFSAPFTNGGEVVSIPGGEYRPFFRMSGNENETVRVAAFEMDRLPASNAEFLEFVRVHPEWRRSQVKRIYADEGYLAHWAGDLDLGAEVDPAAPVTRVSWFAARACAAWRGMRLATLAEWELTAAAPGVDGRSPTEVILAWYARPATAEEPAATFTNTLGVSALHGAIWEWVEDFNSGFAGGDSRSREEIERAAFCGAGALSAADRADYATFMRHAFRNSLKGRYTGRLLGFRCARDTTPDGVPAS